MLIQFKITTNEGDSYLAKGDADFWVITSIFNNRDAVKARLKGITSITMYYSAQGFSTTYETVWRV